MMHLNMGWLFLFGSVCCIAIAGNKLPMARWAGLVFSCVGIGWAILNNDYGLVPFNVILIAIACLEYLRSTKTAKVVQLEQPAAKPRRKAA